MKENLILKVEYDIRFVIKRFLDSGWRQVDVNVIEKGKHPEPSLTLLPRMLTYEEDSEQKLVIWTGCVYETDSGDLVESLKVLQALKADFLKFPDLLYFKDQDALLDIFSCVSYGDFTEYIAYFNPDYPDGYWENHTL